MPRAKQPAAAEPVHVVRRWESSPILYGWDSRDRKENPDFHPPILLTSKGAFVDERLLPLAADQVPAYVREAAKGTNLDIEYHKPSTHAMTMTDAMLGAGVPDTDPDPRVRASRGRRAA